MRTRSSSGGGGDGEGPTLGGRLGRVLVVTFAAALAIAAAADLLVHHHEHFGIEDTFGFHAGLGLVAGAAGIVAAVALGRVLRRPDPRGSSGSGAQEPHGSRPRTGRGAVDRGGER